MTENYADTARKTNEKYGSKYHPPLNHNKIRSIIIDIKYTGFYGFDGNIIGNLDLNNQPHEGMVAIDKLTYDKAQNIISKRRQDKSKKLHYPPIIKEWRKIYGPEYVFDKLDYSPRCPHCHSTDITKQGSQVRNGTLHRLYLCKKENFIFRSPSALQINYFKSLLWMRCMKCGTVDNFKVGDSKFVDFLEVICNECGYLVLVKKDNYF